MGRPPVLNTSTARQDIPCLLCGSPGGETMHEKPPFRIVRCSSCTMVYTLPRLPSEDIARMYQEDYWNSEVAKDFGYTDYLADEELYVKTFKMRAALLKKYRPVPARVLDVGCAAGFALRAFRELGYEAYGVELSAKMAQEAERRAGDGRVHAGVLEPGLFGGIQFDIITMWDLVEHLEDPGEILSIARKMLAPDGVLILETQNVNSLFAKVMGVRWQHYKFEEHLYHFNPTTIRTLLERSGLETLEVSARRGGKYISLHFFTERVGRIHPILSTLMAPLKVLGNPKFYANVFDEMLVVSKASKEAASHG